MASFNRTTLFSYIRRAPFGGRLTQSQVDGVNRLLDTCAQEGVTNLEFIAYILASVFRETGMRMQPCRETFATSDAQAKARLDHAYAAGQLTWVKSPYWRQGWFGRGDIQLTHLDNYVRATKELGVDLVRNPDKALDPQISARVAVIGMRDGWFTGKKLSHYFGGPIGTEAQEKVKATRARAIVNGKDKAALIAGYFWSFLCALQAASEATPQPVDVTSRAAQPDDVPIGKSWSVKAIVSGLFGGTFSIPFIGDVQSIYALGAFALLLIAAGVFGWLIWSGRLSINRGGVNNVNNPLDVDAGQPPVVELGDTAAAGSDSGLAVDSADLDPVAAAGASGPGGSRWRPAAARARTPAGRGKRKAAAKGPRRQSRKVAAGGGR